MDNIKERLNNLGNISFKEFFFLLGKIQIKVFISLVSTIIIFSFFMFKIGQQYQAGAAALSLCRLFSLSLDLEEGEAANNKINYRGIYLLESSEPSPIRGKVFLEIRKYNEGGGTEKIGLIHAVKPEMKPVPRVSLPEFTKKVYARAIFQWHGHKKDRNFAEKYVSPNTIRRYYDDGWILEYKVNKQRKAISSSFRWIKKGD